MINIWESYPVLRVILATLLISAIIFKIAWPASVKSLEDLRLRDRLLALTVHGLLGVLVATSFSTNTLAFSSNRVSNELGANGISSLFRAFFTNNLDYTRHYRTIEKSRAFALTRVITSYSIHYTKLYEGPFKVIEIHDKNGALLTVGQPNARLFMRLPEGAQIGDLLRREKP